MDNHPFPNRNIRDRHINQRKTMTTNRVNMSTFVWPTGSQHQYTFLLEHQLPGDRDFVEGHNVRARLFYHDSTTKTTSIVCNNNASNCSNEGIEVGNLEGALLHRPSPSFSKRPMPFLASFNFSRLCFVKAMEQHLEFITKCLIMIQILCVKEDSCTWKGWQ